MIKQKKLTDEEKIICILILLGNGHIQNKQINEATNINISRYRRKPLYLTRLSSEKLDKLYKFAVKTMPYDINYKLPEGTDMKSKSPEEGLLLILSLLNSYHITSMDISDNTGMKSSNIEELRKYPSYIFKCSATEINTLYEYACESAEVFPTRKKMEETIKKLFETNITQREVYVKLGVSYYSKIKNSESLDWVRYETLLRLYRYAVTLN
ncbi:hypothetical protein NGC89_02510 [Staphylococcus xylosus]|uniref:hypothetical protein n=1 Tax=Staphylococcus xylosus TaxID=1288 RepID=UPI002DB65469|nr:hypothetical protein [Staphylococcus xylosus]MEB7800338.1 hypothetical protein [Staphylococcus xylosus]